MYTDNEASTSAMSLMDIPNEMITKIFGNLTTDELDALQLVNVRCYDIIYSHIWPLVKEFNGYTRNNELNVFQRCYWQNYSSAKLVSYFKRCTKMEKLQLPGFPCASFTMELHLLPRLSYINLYAVPLENCHLEAIATHCTKLKAIRLEYCFNTSNVDAGLGSLFRSCTELEVVSLWGAREFHGTFLSDLPSNVRCLDLRSCVYLRVHNLNKFFNNDTNLEAFLVSSIKNVTTENVNHWFRHMPKLRFLKTFGLVIREVQDVQINFKHMPHLEIIDHPNCAPEKLTHLRKLTFLSTNQKGAINISTLPFLKFFESYGYNFVDSKIVIHDNIKHLSFVHVQNEAFSRVAEAIHGSKNLVSCDIRIHGLISRFIDAARKLPEDRNGKPPVVVAFMDNYKVEIADVPKWIVLKRSDKTTFTEKASFDRFWENLNIL